MPLLDRNPEHSLSHDRLGTLGVNVLAANSWISSRQNGNANLLAGGLSAHQFSSAQFSSAQFSSAQFSSAQLGAGLQVSDAPIPPDNAGNSLSLAQNLGNLAHNLTTSYSDWIGGTDPNDFYQFNLVGQSNFRVSLTGLSADANLELFNANGQIISSSALTGTAAESIDLTGLAAGGYFARVYSTQPATTYSLSFLTDYTRVDGTVQNRGPLLFDPIETKPINIRIPAGVTDQVIDNTDTWIVIHGHRSAPDGSIGELARTIGQNHQVLVLDWSAEADNPFARPDLSARWIHEVANFVVNTLQTIWGITANHINLIGHSLGGYVASEVGAIFTGPNRQNPQVNDMIALDPARSSALAGYDINGLVGGFQAISNFRDVSTFSRAFWGEGLPIPGQGGEGLGSERYAHSADESFRIEFEASDDAIANHSNIITLFINMLQDPTNPISRLFQLDQGPQNYWEVSDGDEGFILVNAQNRPKELYFLTPASNWVDAQNRAVAAGGNLVTINDATEKNRLRSTFSSRQDVWIGLTDSSLYGATEGTFLWASRQAVTYTNWAKGEPNNKLSSPEGEDFVAMNLNSGGWNDLPFGAVIRGLVEVA